MLHMESKYISIKNIAEAKGFKSTRSLRLELNKPESKYISREVKVNGGYSYEILFSSLEPELQQKLRESETKSTSLVPLNYQLPMVTDKAKLTRNHRINIVKAALEKRKEYKTIKESDSEFLDLYNTGLYLSKAYNFLGTISIGTLRRWIQIYKKHENADCLIPQYKTTKQGEYNSILDDKMKNILLEAYNKLKRKHNNPSTGAIIAELTFGFWINLCKKSYKNSLWDKQDFFNNVFPDFDSYFNSPTWDKTKVMFPELKEILRLRNRIFHHEIIINNKNGIENCYDKTHRVLYSLSKEYAEIFEDSFRFKDIIMQKP